jgi:serine/threonine-protein kinase
MRPALAALLASALLAAGAAARAQGNDAAIAEALFEEGRKLMVAGDLARACPKLAESERLDPGVGTLLNLGDCWERDHKIASAWAAFVEAEALANRAGQTARARYAAEKSAALEPRLSHLIVRVADDARTRGMIVLRDREILGEATWGVPMPIDPGTHTIEVEAPDRRPWRREIDVAEDGSTLQIDVPPLEVVDVTAPPPRVVVLPPPLPPQTPPEPRGNATLRWWGVGVGAAGVAGIGAALTLGAVAMAKDAHTRELGCTRTTCPTVEGVAAAHDARVIANVATAVTVVGAVAIAAGVTMFIVSLPRARAAAALELGPGSAFVRGAF